MGQLVDGEWVEAPERGHDEQGFDDWITAEADAEYPATGGRYHLYISRACPWAHRAALTRRLLGLTDEISLDIVDPVRNDDGWAFTPSKDGCTPESVHGFDYLRDVYMHADPDYTGRVTVPVLYDTHHDTVVNNESADIARMLATEFEGGSDPPVLYPASKRDEIDSIIDSIHADINLGVYEAGFADSQADYEQAVTRLFEALAQWDEVLRERRFLIGDDLTLADVFFFPTLYRFDAVYHTHFKCNVQRLVDFEHLWDYARDIYQHQSVAATCNMTHVKAHYYRSHEDLNPTGFVPVGPETEWSASHDRARFADGKATSFSVDA